MTQSNTPSAQRPSGRVRGAKFTKKTALMLGVLPAAAALALAGTGAASAVTSGTYTTSNVNIRTAPSTSATSLGEGQPGQVAYVYCATTGTTVNGSNEWVYNADHTTGVGSGYSASQYVTWNGGIPTC